MQWRISKSKCQQNSGWWLWLGLAWISASCGVDEARHYPEKNFLGAPTTTQPKQGNSDAEAVVPEQPQFKRDAGSEEIESPETNVDPQTIVLQMRYQSKFDIPTARKLVNGEQPSSSLGLARSTIEDRLSGTTPKDGLTVTQYYGDGASRSEGRQLIVNTPADEELEDGQDSNSGVQVYDRTVTDPGCPGQLVCIDRLRFEPTVGVAMTICFRDAAGKSVAIPYAISPAASFEDLTKIAKTYGPYKGFRYREDDMDCSQPTVAPDVVEDFEVVVTAPQKIAAAYTRYFQDPQKLNQEFEVGIENRRLANDGNSPYLDETLKLQMRSKYIFDGGRTVLAKMIKTVRNSVKLDFPINLLVDIDGLQVDVHFELCENLLDAKNGQYCVAKQPR